MKIKIFLLISVMSLLAMASVSAAGSYQINWWTVDSGGGTIQSGDGQYTLSGTIGQPDTSLSTGGGYTLNGGFWQGITAAFQEFLSYIPLVNR